MMAGMILYAVLAVIVAVVVIGLIIGYAHHVMYGRRTPPG